MPDLETNAQISNSTNTRNIALIHPWGENIMTSLRIYLSEPR